MKNALPTMTLMQSLYTINLLLVLQDTAAVDRQLQNYFLLSLFLTIQTDLLKGSVQSYWSWDAMQDSCYGKLHERQEVSAAPRIQWLWLGAVQATHCTKQKKGSWVSLQGLALLILFHDWHVHGMFNKSCIWVINPCVYKSESKSWFTLVESES